MLLMYPYGLVHCFPKFLLADPFWLRKLTTDPHILADVNIACPDDSRPKLKKYICIYICIYFWK
jgi:hypothetical protein